MNVPVPVPNARLSASSSLLSDLNELSETRKEHGCFDKMRCINSLNYKGSHGCINCVDCFKCMNCINVTDAIDCHHCSISINCNDCHYCVKVTNCYGCTRCYDCENCIGCTDMAQHNEGFWMFNKQVSEERFKEGKALFLSGGRWW